MERSGKMRVKKGGHPESKVHERTTSYEFSNLSTRNKVAPHSFIVMQIPHDRNPQ